MHIRKRLTGLLLTTTLLVAAVPAVAADQPQLGVYLNGRELYMPQPPIMKDGRVLVPMRAYGESLGAEIAWHPPDRVTASLSGHAVELQIGSTTAMLDGQPVQLDVPAQLINDKTYLPIRFLSEGLGGQVDYDGKSVSVRTGGPPRLQVIDGPLNVRQGPSTSSNILTTVPNGTVLDVVQHQPPSAWSQVRLPRGMTGWVANQFTRLVSSQPLVEPFEPALRQAEGFLQVGGECLGVTPLIDGHLVVPLRESVERLGGTVSFDGPTVLVRLGSRQLSLTPGETTAVLNDQPRSLSAAPSLMGGQVMISARLLADLLSIPLVWTDQTRTATLGSSTAPGAACNPAISANSYIVVDAATGVVLSEYHSRSPYPIASTTKIMTALLAVEQGNPDSVVTVSWNASNQPGTSVYLRAGEQRNLRELLYGLMLVSGNDAATAIAEHLGGNESNFAQTMNRRAAELGATQTYFYNASGLDDWVNPYSTARDLAAITRYATQNPEFRVYMSQSQMRIPGPSGTRLLTNRNDFVLKYPGATGVKNGWTEKADHTLVASGFRNNREVIVVLLGAPSRTSLYQQAYALMDHGFRMAERSWLLQ